MSTKTVLTGFIAVSLAAAGVASAAPRSSSTHQKSPVPPKVRRAIARHYRQFAYLPTRVPSGLQYTSYSGIRGFEFTISFDGTHAPSLQYEAMLASCSTQGSPTHSFEVNGVDVLWTGTYTDQRAWRCITHNGNSVVVSASRSVQGDANPIAPGNTLTPKQHRHALELARVVAYAEPIR